MEVVEAPEEASSKALTYPRAVVATSGKQAPLPEVNPQVNPRGLPVENECNLRDLPTKRTRTGLRLFTPLLVEVKAVTTAAASGALKSR